MSKKPRTLDESIYSYAHKQGTLLCHKCQVEEGKYDKVHLGETYYKDIKTETDYVFCLLRGHSPWYPMVLWATKRRWMHQGQQGFNMAHIIPPPWKRRKKDNG